MLWLRQSTSRVVRVGPFVDVSDGATPETGITLSGADQAEVLKANGATTVSIASNTWAAISGADGWYDLTLGTGNTDTLGELVVVVQDLSVCLPVFVRAMVVPANVWDSYFSTDKLEVDLVSMEGVTSAATALRRTYNTVHTDTAQAGSTSSITLASGASSTNDYYNGWNVYLYNNTGAAQAPRLITDYDGSTKVASVAPNFVTAPDATTGYVLVGSGSRIEAIDGTVTDLDTLNTTIGSLNNLSQAEANAACDSAISDAFTFSGANVDANVAAISGDATAADKLEEGATAVVLGSAATGTLSTSVMTTDLSEATNDHYNGRRIIFTSGVLAGQERTIDDYAGSGGTVTFDSALTEAPSDGDSFVIV